MHRIPSAVVLAFLGALFPRPVLAQSMVRGTSVEAPSGAKPDSTKPGPSKPLATASASAPPAGLSDEAELSRVVGLYEAGKYIECSAEIERLLDPTARKPFTQPAIIENARVYWAACLLGAGDGAAADAPLRAAIHENPQMKPPDSLVFPAPVVEHFLKVRDSLVNEIRAAEQAHIKQAQAEARRRQEMLDRDRGRLLALEQLARQQTVVIKNRRWLAFVPFGVGQFQNGEVGLGYTLLAGQAVFSSLSLAAIVAQSRLATEADRTRAAGNRVDEVSQQQNIRAWSTVKTGSFWVFAALAVGGIVQAQLAYVPEFREVRTRPLPPALAPSPAPAPVSVSAVPYVDQQGAGFTLVGRF